MKLFPNEPNDNIAQSCIRYSNKGDVRWYVPEYTESFGDDNECFLVMVVGIDVTDWSTGELERKLAISFWQIIS